MTDTDAAAAEDAVPDVPAVQARKDLVALLEATVRESLRAADASLLDTRAEGVVAALLAALCPPGRVLLRMEAVREDDGGTNNFEGYEAPYSYATLGNLEIVHDAIEDEAADLLVEQVYDGELAETVSADLCLAVTERFAPPRPEQPTTTHATLPEWMTS